MPESIANQLDDEELEAIMLMNWSHPKSDNLIANLQLTLALCCGFTRSCGLSVASY